MPQEIPEITPQVVHLVDLLKRAREGRLRVPTFQREFVWRRQDIVDLFDSIAKQYPIGTLFLWGTARRASSRSQIGPLQVPDHAGERFLVLDGQQRLTALVGVLLADEVDWVPGDDADQWRLYFDAKEQSFTHGARGPNPPQYVPVTALLDTVKLFELMGTMNSAVREPDTVRTWISRAQEVARALQGYRIPIVEIKTDSLSIAVESFSRLNKKGRTIGQDEMFSALTFEEGTFHLASKIDEIQREMIQSGFGQVDRATLLRAILTAANLDIYRTDWTTLGDPLKTELRANLPSAVDEARTALGHAREFLRQLGVLNARMLPYSMQLVALSAFFGRCSSPTPEQHALLRRWFWVSAFTGWFGIGNPTSVRKLVEELRDRVASEPQPTDLEHFDLAQSALPTPLTFDLRSARVRVLLCVLFALRPQRPDGTPVTPDEAANLLFSRGPEAMTVVCATVRDGDLRKSPANRILDIGDRPGQAKNWLLDLDPALVPDVLLSHAIPPTAFDLLREGQNDAFLAARLTEITRLEAEFMAANEVRAPSNLRPITAPIDTDDVPPLGDAT